MKKTAIKASLCLFISLLSISLAAQTTDKIAVTGTVLDAQKIPVPGVYVIEKGTQNGTVTDFDGNYSIMANPQGTLEFSFVGLKKMSIPVDGKGVHNVTMVEDMESLDEVVVVGYGSQKREAITGAVESIKGEEIEDLPVGNLAAALVGRVLGVGVSGGNARPGEPARLTIRNPLTGNNIRAKDATSTDPLYVIDGVVQIDPNTGYSDPTYFNTLDASQVESISFLKDASAAIYGSRAAQGVVLVTTKRGKKGPAQFSYSGNFSIDDEAYRTEVLNAYEYGKVFNILNSINPDAPEYDPNAAAPNEDYFFSPTELNHFKTLNYNALDEYWSASMSQRHNINLTGGSDDATYFGGISYYTQEGNLGTLDYNRWSFRAGANMNLGKGFKADIQVNGYFTDVSRTASSIGNQSAEDDYRQLQNRTPFMPMYVDGLPAVLIGSDGGDELIGFHYGELQRLQNLSENKDSNVGLLLNLEYEVPFIKGLKLKANYARQEGGGRGNQKGSIYELYQFYGADPDLSDNDYNLDPPRITVPAGQRYVVYESGSGPLGSNIIRDINEIVNNDRALIDNSRSGSEQIRFQASYDQDFGKSSISALFAVERAERFFNEERIIGYGVPEFFDGMLWQLTGEIDDDLTFNRKGESGDLGYIGRLNYSYDNKYYGEFLFRSDASAKFAPENYWGNFYTLAGGWIVSNENFFKSNIFDYLKLRMSLGFLGKDDIKPWQWRQNFDFREGSGGVFGGNGGITDGYRDSGQANRDVQWGEEFKTNFGLEARFLDNRLSLSAESFFNYGTNLLINLNAGVPFTVGGSVAASNSGKANTWGQEFSVGWSDNIGDFNYGVNFNVGWYNNNIIEGNFSNPDNWYPWQVNKPGNSDIGTWGYDYLGMFKNQADIDNYLNTSGVTKVFDVDAQNLQPGMLYYRDVRGEWDPETRTFAEKDGIIDEWDQIQLQKPARGPQGFASNWRFSYKGISLNTVLTVGWGGYREVGSAKSPFDSDRIRGNYENRPSFWANMYHPELNPNGTIPNLSPSINDNVGLSEGGINTVSSEFWRVSSFSMIMRNINLSYTLPKEITEKIGFRSFRVNFVALNPFILFNPYKDYDLTPYGSYDSYPTLRTFSLGVNVGL